MEGIKFLNSSDPTLLSSIFTYCESNSNCSIPEGTILFGYRAQKPMPPNDKIKLISFEDDFDEDIQFLRIPNMNSTDNPVRPRRTNFKSFSKLNGEVDTVKDKLAERIFSGSLLDTRLNIDYGRRNAEIAPDANDYSLGSEFEAASEAIADVSMCEDDKFV